MKKPCTPQFIQKIHRKHRSWRVAAKQLNSLYDVDLPHLAWRDYAAGHRDIANNEIRTALMLGPRPCQRCGSKPGIHFSRLLKRLKPRDLLYWQKLRKKKRYKAAQKFLNEVYNRKTIR